MSTNQLRGLSIGNNKFIMPKLFGLHHGYIMMFKTKEQVRFCIKVRENENVSTMWARVTIVGEVVSDFKHEHLKTNTALFNNIQKNLQQMLLIYKCSGYDTIYFFPVDDIPLPISSPIR